MEQMTLFDREMPQPLAARLRPRSLEEYAGQTHLLGKGKVLRRLIESDQVSSMIFWGPPGVGKTTLARIIAGRTKSSFIDFSAVTSGIKEIRIQHLSVCLPSILGYIHASSIYLAIQLSTHPCLQIYIYLYNPLSSTHHSSLHPTHTHNDNNLLKRDCI